jgi:hypothetical protein
VPPVIGGGSDVDFLPAFDYSCVNFESGVSPLTRRVPSRILALLIIISMLAWGIPSAHAECASGCGCESANHGTRPGVDARVRGMAPDCCSGHEGDPCQAVLKQSFPRHEYALAAPSRQETLLPESSAPGATLASLPDHFPGRDASPWKAPPASPGPPLYLSYLTLLI